MDRIQGNESTEVEFKAAGGGLPKDLWPTLSAFANTNGGWVILGVAEADDDRHMIRGLKDPSGLEKLLFDQLRSREKISFPVCVSADVSSELVGDKTVLVVRVPAASRRSKPVYINNNPYTGTYLRRGSGDYRCSKQEVDRMMRDASEIGLDSSVLPGFGLDDIDPDALARFRRRFQSRDPGSPWNHYGDSAFLRATGGTSRDHETGEEGLTVAGLLMLGRHEAIRAWRPRHLIDYRSVPSRLPGVDWSDRLDWDGNLLGAFEAIYARLTATASRPFKLSGEVRMDEGPTGVALREALVNLLVHADYSEPQASLVLQGPEGTLFRNPGSSRVPASDLLTGDRSDPRNPVLVRMFRLIGLAEEAGSGIPRIRRAWNELGFRLPAIDVGTERYEFSIDLRQVHLHSEEDLVWLAGFRREFTEAEQLALVIARNEGEIDNRTLCQTAGIHPTDATKTLVRLRDDRLLEMHGDRRTARYLLGPMAAPGAPEDTSQTPAILQDNELSLVVKGLGPDLEPALALTLAEASQPIRTLRRSPPAMLEAAILELCSQAPLSIRALATLTTRVEPYLQQVVARLVRAGRLEMIYPDRPRHRRQRYRTTRDGQLTLIPGP